MESNKEGACLVIGAGDDTGAAIANAFAEDGLTACVVRRPRHEDKLKALAQSIQDRGFKAEAISADARDENAMM